MYIYIDIHMHTYIKSKSIYIIRMYTHIHTHILCKVMHSIYTERERLRFILRD